MLKQLRLSNFRSFVDFTLNFGEGAFLVGPNNAGKSTILTSIRVADTLIRYAYRRNPDFGAMDRDARVTAYPIALRESPPCEIASDTNSALPKPDSRCHGEMGLGSLRFGQTKLNLMTETRSSIWSRPTAASSEAPFRQGRRFRRWVSFQSLGRLSTLKSFLQMNT